MIFLILFIWAVSLWIAYETGYGEAKEKYEQSELCSHGYEWDDCPDCCH